MDEQIHYGWFGGSYRAEHKPHSLTGRRFPFHVLVHTTRGAYRVQTQQGTWIAHTGECVFVPRLLVHDISMTALGAVSHMHFTATLLDGDLLSRVTVPAVFSGEAAACCEAACQRSVSGRSNETSVECRIRQDCAVAEILLGLGQVFPVAPETRSELTMRCISFLEENLVHKVTLQSLSNAVYSSPSTVEKTFQRDMGQSVFAWLRKRRMEQAAVTLLRTGSAAKTSQIMHYCDSAYFHRAFCVAYGMTPGEFLSMLRKTGAQYDKEK